MPLGTQEGAGRRRVSIVEGRRGSVAHRGSVVGGDGSPKSPKPSFEGDTGSPATAGRRSTFGPGGRASPTLPPGQAGSPRKRRVSVVKGADGEDSNSNVKVFLRVRPFNTREIRIHGEHNDSMLRSIIDMPDGPHGMVHFMERLKNDEDGDEEFVSKETFEFDRGLWSITEEQQPYKHEFCDQENVFEYMGSPALAQAWKGFNTCIFAYGQTGAGKTHTMMGHFTCTDGQLTGHPGVIPHLCKELYRSIETRQAEANEKKVITLAYETELCAYEIYNEKVRDLFYTHTPGRKAKDELRVRKHPLDGPFVDGISKLSPESWEDCIADIEEGNAQRTTGATAMNAESSRSHSVFQIKFTQIETSIPQERFEKPVTNRKYSVINLIDLAGSERNKKSQAAGERLVEATNINLSLTTLKRVIDALVHNSKAEHRNNPKQIPYRDSILTHLLSHSLGGNSKTTMVACVSPHYDNAEETLNTLRYASQARRIVNVVRVNEDSKAKQNLLLKEQLAQLQDELTQRKEGDFSPAEIAALEDEIRAGQDTLKQHEEEAKRLRQEKDDEVEKRYQQAFQHSFQMVVMRKQKEKALMEAANAKKLGEEAKRFNQEKEETEKKLALMKRDQSNLRRVYEQTKSEKERYEAERESALTKAYGLQWIEKQKRILAERNATKALTEAEQLHRVELEAVIDQAAKQCEDLKHGLGKKDDEIDTLQSEVEALRDTAHRAAQDCKTAEAKVEEYQTQCQRIEEVNAKKLRDFEYRSRLDFDENRNKLQVQIESLQRQLEEQRIRYTHQEEVLVRENEERKRMMDFTTKNEIKRSSEESERRRRTQNGEWEDKLTEAHKAHYEEVRDIKIAHKREMEQTTAQYEAKLAEYREKIEDQIQVLEEVKKREVKYSQLAHQLESAIDRKAAGDIAAGSSPDLRDFLDLVRSYTTQLTSFPINRAKVERASLPVSAFVSQAPPMVGGYEDSSWQDPALAGTTGSNGFNASRTSMSRSPTRRRNKSSGRKSEGSPGGYSPRVITPKKK
eukprot:TRINITY_DN38_c0_g2_i1.p1 TRINITY_DN38_c0_g2~~TRINITY_DN38_c0_g2_i1.p1  ORF type:complete len:1023 (+),score=472.43 TRINITY_DN38_c0_g2_i1:111-3179(+)